MSHKVGTSLRYSLLLSVPVWCAFVSSEAMAACTPGYTPANNQTVNCTGANTTAVIAPAGVTGVTVNVAQGASITGVGQQGGAGNYTSVFINGSSTVNNAGAITPSTANSTAVGVNLNGSNSTLNNSGTITVSNTTTATKTLYGVITSAPDGADYSNVNVVNTGTIALTQNAAATARAVYSGENIDSMTVDNYGTISVVKNGNATSTNGVAAIDSDDDTDTLTVNNHAGAKITASGGNTFAVGGRAQDYTLVNDGTITGTGTITATTVTNTAGAVTRTANTNGAAILIYGPGDATILNSATGVVNGDVYITDLSPINPNARQAGNDYTRNSVFTNEGIVNGTFRYGNGTHKLDNSGTINGSIVVNQIVPISPSGTSNGVTTAAGTILPGGASFTLNNTGAISGDITITDRADSVNDINLKGTGFAGNIIATNGTGTNSLNLQGVTNLASVQNFKNLDLNRSNVAVTNGVSLVSGATVKTTVYGQGGTRAAPSTSLGTINGTLTLAGPTTLVVNFKDTYVRNGDVYQVASTVNGAGAADITVKQRQTALVQTSRADTSDGRLLLVTNVRDPRNFAGVSQPTGATLNGLLTYDGTNPQVRALGAAVEALPTQAAVRAAGDQLAPNTNGADIQVTINATMLFHQQIDSRLDNYIFAQIPSSGRSADLGPGRPAPVYGVLPADGGWIEGIGGGVHQSTVNNVGGYNAELEGVIGGLDRLITPNIRVGGAFGFINGQVNGNQVGGRQETIQTFQGLGYAELSGTNYYLRGSAGYGGVNIQSSRQIAFAGFSDTAFGSHSGNVFTARGEGGAPFEYRNSLLIPYAAFTYSRLEQNAYTEVSANGAGLSYQFARNNSERSEVGGKVVVPLASLPAFSYLFPAGSSVALEARAAYVHEFGNVAQTVSASFTGGGGVFVAAGPVPNRDMVDYGVGLRVGSGRVQFDISYNGVARSTYLQQVGLLRARYLF